jgi:hypothetical protein
LQFQFIREETFTMKHHSSKDAIALTARQIAQIKELVPQGMQQSVRSSLFEQESA